MRLNGHARARRYFQGFLDNPSASRTRARCFDPSSFHSAAAATQNVALILVATFTAGPQQEKRKTRSYSKAVTLRLSCHLIFPNQQQQHQRRRRLTEDDAPCQFIFPSLLVTTSNPRPFFNHCDPLLPCVNVRVVSARIFSIPRRRKQR